MDHVENTILKVRTASKVNKEDEVVQVDSLLYALGPEAENIFKTVWW